MGKSKAKHLVFDYKKFVALFEKNDDLYKPLEFFERVFEFLEKYHPEIAFTVLKHEYPPAILEEIVDSQLNEEVKQKFYNKKKSDLKKVGSLYNFNDIFIYPVEDNAKAVKYILAFKNISSTYFEDVEQLCQWMQRFYSLSKSNYDRGLGYSQIHNANLISQMCHDFNSLITLIKTHDLIKDEALLKRMQYSVKMTKDILIYVRELELLPSTVNLNELMNGVLQKISKPSNIDIAFSPLKKETNIIVDVELFDKAISEVLENAIIASGANSKQIDVKIETGNSISVFADRDWYIIRIKDSGCGILPDFLPFVKNPFFTTMKSENHNGLGLSIAEKIIREHGGYIDIVSKPEEETVVSLFLPQ